MMTPFFTICLVTAVTGSFFEKEVTPSCGPDVKVCEFFWTIDFKETMVNYVNESHRGKPVVIMNETLYRRETCNTFELLTDEELQNVTTADGRYKLVYTINQQVPGPSVVVYQGQEVVIHVKNKLMSDGVTIHWHGFNQLGTPWMDGVGSISQCPIDPEATFVYRFVANEVGTRFYHAHQGTMRTDGIAGPFIVLPRASGNTDNAAGTVDKDYVMFLQDWFLRSGPEIWNYLDTYLNPFFHGPDKEGCTTPRTSQDGEITADIPFESALINGKGRYNHTQPNDGLLYEVFTVTTSEVYRFRIINAAMVYAFQVSIDQHPMTVISADGNEVIEFEVDSVVVHSGERFDIILHADQPPGSYWIRVETMDTPETGESSSPSFGLAVLRYHDTEVVLPASKKTVCERSKPCRVVNCPFLYNSEHNTECTSVADLKATTEEQTLHPVPAVNSAETFQEFFLNFVYARSRSPISAAVNNKGFMRPSVPPQTYPNDDEMFTKCVERCDEYCTCTHVIKLNVDNTVQLVLLNINDNSVGLAHPVHVHGHHPHVIKMAYPEYDRRNGRISGPNKDIRCDTPICDNATWSDSSWRLGKIPGVNLNNPPRKDTIIVPRQGYVVLRMTADNPGYWFLHCHIEIHQIAGMSLMVQEGEVSDMPALPKGFPTCGNFGLDRETKTFSNGSLSALLGGVPAVSETDNEGSTCVTLNEPNQASWVVQNTGYVLPLCFLVISNVVTLAVTFIVKQRRRNINFLLDVPCHKRPTETNGKPEPEVFYSKSVDLSGSKEKLLLT